MSDTTVTDTTTPSTPEPVASPEGTPEATEDHQPDPRNAEAAKWRKRLRETEAERDTLQAELETYRAADTDRLHDAARKALDDRLSYCSRLTDDAQAALLEVIDPARFVTEDGEINEEAIDAYAAPLAPRPMRRSGLKGWQSGGSGGDRDAGSGGGGGWKDLIQK